ncbi:HIT domain-containing protein [Candidatus Beckwithbacteria bacterium]|nr:HIT domain-containing protein [Candidatus Beckwithbacteria bacterium]
MNCLFCNLTEENINKIFLKKIFETEHFIFVRLKKDFRIIDPHCLLISKKCFREETSMNKKIWEDYYVASKKAYQYMFKQTKRECMIFINPPQMQSVPHFHRHFVDGVFGIHGVANALSEYAKKIDSKVINF